jgi:hypothetical protein
MTSQAGELGSSLAKSLKDRMDLASIPFVNSWLLHFLSKLYGPNHFEPANSLF